eukprot:366349-Chlamydomonas_euryale.AAC.7
MFKADAVPVLTWAPKQGTRRALLASVGPPTQKQGTRRASLATVGPMRAFPASCPSGALRAAARVMAGIEKRALLVLAFFACLACVPCLCMPCLRALLVHALLAYLACACLACACYVRRGELGCIGERFASGARERSARIAAHAF